MSERIVMTYGVPYSFVPGTKAKADEVNANFIDVLGKIENTTTRTTALESGKADNTDIDGQWTSSTRQIASDVSVNGSTNITFNIEAYLPADGNKYEVIAFAIGTSSGTSGQINACYLNTDLFSTYTCLFRNIPRTNSPVYSGGNTTLIVGTGRQVILTRSSSYYGTVTIYLIGYRKVR